MTATKRTEVEICAHCSGNGEIKQEHCTDYHKSEWSTTWSVCDMCEGSGRIVVKMTVEKRPFKTRSKKRPAKTRSKR
jgi:DnaJ-class molecular chaperone